MLAKHTHWLLEEMSLANVREAAPQVAVLPMGATEPHNLHLPYGTDTIEAGQLAGLCCARAWELGGRVVQLPTLPYGTESNLQAFPLAMNLLPSTLFLVLRDLVHTLENSGILKLLIFNSHGGNDLKPFLREIYGQTHVHIFLCNWYHMIRDAANDICECPDDHAGEMETSLIMAFRPDLVRYDGRGKLTADQGNCQELQFEALRQGWIGLTRPWHLLTTQSGSGNPHAASEAKGQQLAQAVVDRVAPFLAELSQAELNDQFPFQSNEHD